MKKCVILVTNKLYLQKCLNTIDGIINKGRYTDDIVILIGDDLKNEHINIKNEKIHIKYFPDFNRTEIVEILKKNPIGDNRSITKIFQWHKLNCFDIFFKKWDVCFYIDAGMNIFDDINPFFELEWENSIIAHSDAYPAFIWKLSSQFDNENYKDLYSKLEKNYSLNIDYFQSGIMVYDTKIIENETKKILLELSNIYFNSKTNEQGILNLYFNAEKKIWKPLPTDNKNKFYYDFWERNSFKYFEYRMLKYPKTI